jgi:Mce-associated membrane protein
MAVADLTDGRPDPRPLIVVAAAIAVALVVVAVLVAVGDARTGPPTTVRTASSTATEAQRDAALGAARTVAVDFTTLNYRTLSQDFQRLTGLATANFRKAYLNQTNSVAELIIKAKANSQGSVLAIAVQNATPSSADVIAAVNDNVTNTTFPKGKTIYRRLDIKMVHSGSRWLVDAVNPT